MRPLFYNGLTAARFLAWVRWGAVVGFGVVLFAFVRPPWNGFGVAGTVVLAGGLMLVRLRPRCIPVLNYHSVSPCPAWIPNSDSISIDPADLERQLEYLERHDYHPLFISEVHDALSGLRRLRTRSRYVALTFDDGYADNWISVFPLLKKYRMKATLFVTTRTISAASACRPHYVPNGPTRKEDHEWNGYLTWAELKVMQASGLVEIQSHGSSHERLPVAPVVEEFEGPVNAERWGCPVFRQVPALAGPAYFPSQDAVDHMVAWVRACGQHLFDRPDWDRLQREEWNRYQLEHGNTGRYESREEYQRRVAEDLSESRQVLQHELGADSRYLCWPENAFSEEGEKIAHEVGFKATVSNRHRSRNALGDDPARIVRVYIGKRAAGIKSAFLDYLAFVLELKVFEGWYGVYPVLAVIHRMKGMVLAVRRNVLCHRDGYSILV